MTPTLYAALALLATGLAGSFFLYRYQLPRERRNAGRTLFASMEWGDFTQLVLAVLNARGYERGFGGGGTDGEYLLQRRGQDWLLSSRHSRAYTPGTTAIAEFSSHLRQRGIEGGILAIPQRFPRAAHGLARAHRVELLDGASMWNELQPLLTDEQHDAIDRPADARMRWQFIVVWLLAIALGIVVHVALTVTEEAPPVEAPPVGAPLGRDVATPGTDRAQGALLPDRPQGALLPIQQRRQSIADAVARLPHVTSATWPTESTLVITLDSDAFDPRDGICPLLEPDPELSASRLQIQHPPGSTRPIRFLQCRAY